MNNKAQEKHTALPWHVPFSHPTIVHNSAGQCIADCDGNIYIGFDEKEFNAQFIVKAVNCHDDLLEACKLVERAYVGDGVQMSTAVDACLLAVEKTSAQ